MDGVGHEGRHEVLEAGAGAELGEILALGRVDQPALVHAAVGEAQPGEVVGAVGPDPARPPVGVDRRMTDRAGRDHARVALDLASRDIDYLRSYQLSWIVDAGRLAVKRGAGNFFANLYDFNAAINAVLQGRFQGAGKGAGRFLVNSTFGILGFVDVATPMGIRPYRTDFGHTLAIWGAPEGPYIMVPVFGPRTVRSGSGTIFDAYASVQANLGSVAVRNTLWGLELIDGRSRLLEVDELVSGDRYIFVRDAYLQQRRMFVNDGVVQDDFSNFDEDGWGDDF